MRALQEHSHTSWAASSGCDCCWLPAMLAVLQGTVPVEAGCSQGKLGVAGTAKDADAPTSEEPCCFWGSTAVPGTTSEEPCLLVGLNCSAPGQHQRSPVACAGSTAVPRTTSEEPCCLWGSTAVPGTATDRPSSIASTRTCCSRRACLPPQRLVARCLMHDAVPARCGLWRSRRCRSAAAARAE